MKTIRAFIAGIAFPALVLPFIYTILYLAGHDAVRTYPLQFMPLYIPILFGLWNSLYFVIGDRCPFKHRNPRLWAQGAILGFLVALVGVFIIGLPKLLFGFTGGMQYLPLIIVPIVYGIIWRYVIKHLNDLVGLEDK